MAITNVLIVTVAIARTKEHTRWVSLKLKLIRRFGTVRAAAAAVDCHPNALREVSRGGCPNVRAKLIALGVAVSRIQWTEADA